MEDYTITVIGNVDDSKLTPKGGASLISKELPVEILKSNIADFVTKIGASLDGLNSTIHGYHLDEILFNVEISANGSVRLIGAFEAGARGGITLKFKEKSK